MWGFLKLLQSILSNRLKDIYSLFSIIISYKLCIQPLYGPVMSLPIWDEAGPLHNRIIIANKHLTRLFSLKDYNVSISFISTVLIYSSILVGAAVESFERLGFDAESCRKT